MDEATKDTRGISNYTESMRQLRDFVAPLAETFGIAYARSLVIQRRWREGGEKFSDTYCISPTPIIGRKPPQIANADNTSISIKQDLLLVEGVSRKYPREHIIGTGINYWVDAQISSNGIIGGFECDLYSIDEHPLTWNLILRRITDERRGV